LHWLRLGQNNVLDRHFSGVTFLAPVTAVRSWACVTQFHAFLTLFFFGFDAALKLAAVGAPLVLGRRIFSPEPALIRFRFA